MCILPKFNEESLMWKERMRPKVSNAEILVFQELSRLGLTIGMVTQKTITLRKADGTKIETIPDFTWQLSRKLLYLDGDEIHKGWRIDRDNKIMETSRCLRTLAT